VRTREASQGKNEFGVGCRDTQLQTDELLRACVDNLLSWDDESARSGTSLGWRVCRSVDWQHVHTAVHWRIDRTWAADARKTAEPAFMNVPIVRRVVMAALGRQPRRRAEQPARCIWTPCIARQAWLTGGAAVSAAGEGRAEGEHWSTFSCRSCHLSVVCHFKIDIDF